MYPIAIFSIYSADMNITVIGKDNWMKKMKVLQSMYTLRLVIYCQNSDSIHIRHHDPETLLINLLSKIRSQNSIANLTSIPTVDIEIGLRTTEYF